MAEKNTTTINISTMSILKVIFIILGLWFVYAISDILILVFTSFVLASAIQPVVERFYRHRIPRVLSVAIIYLIVFGVIILSVGILIPPITEEVRDLAKSFPYYYEKATIFFKGLEENPNISQNIQEFLTNINKNIGLISSNIVGTIGGIFGGIAGFFIVLVLTFFMAISEDSIKRIIHNVFPDQYQPYLIRISKKIQASMGLWVRGQIILSAIIFVLTLIGLSLLRVEYAWVLALIAGLTELVPFVGPLIGAVPAIFFGFTQSVTTGIAVIVLYLIIQQLENNIIAPKVMSETTGLHPIVVIIVMLVGAKLAGILGIILSIPMAMMVATVIKDIYGEGEEAPVVK